MQIPPIWILRLSAPWNPQEAPHVNVTQIRHLHCHAVLAE